MVFDPENHLILGDFETPLGSKKHGQHLASLRTARVPRPCADRNQHPAAVLGLLGGQWSHQHIPSILSCWVDPENLESSSLYDVGAPMTRML